MFDPRKVSHAQLVEHFWRSVDPAVKDRQFCDVGSQYCTGIFVHDEAQRRVADASRSALRWTKPFKAPIVTKIAPATTFCPAEEYHRDDHWKNPIRYRFYRANCGRDARLKQLWGEQAGKPG